MGNGDGTFNSTSCVITPAQAFTVGDIDNDGSIELLTVGSSPQIHTLDNYGSIINSANFSISPLSSSGWPKLYDVNDDGDLDLFLSSNGTLIEFQNDGTGNFSPCTITNSLSYDFQDVGDLNNDNRIDYSYSTTCSFCDSTVYFLIQQ